MSRFLFLDDCHITRMDNLRRIPHKAQRHPANPLLTFEYPWEATRVQVDGNRVIYDPLAKRCHFSLPSTATAGTIL